MRTEGREESQNVEDRRRTAARTVVGGGLGILILALLVMCMGGNPQPILDQALQNQSTQYAPANPREEEMASRVKVVLRDTEKIWSELFQQMGKTYRPPTMVLFSGSTPSPCGYASAATGPFYCPADEKIYIDLSFYDQLERRFGAPGDFAQAYVLAHEVGHHVQKQLGITSYFERYRRRLTPVGVNKLMVRLELQADFFAGVWAHYAKNWQGTLEQGDFEEAIRAAGAIGDDRLQRQTQGYVVPDTFTHGTSEQRIRWFNLGFQSGDLNQGGTFDNEQFLKIEMN